MARSGRRESGGAVHHDAGSKPTEKEHKSADAPVVEGKAASVKSSESVAKKSPASRAKPASSRAIKAKSDTAKPATRRPAKPKAAAAAPAKEASLSRAASTTSTKTAPKPAPSAPKAAAPVVEDRPVAKRMAENIERIEALGHRLMSALSEKPMMNPGVESPGPDLYLTAANAWMKTLTGQPARVLEQQVNYWGETLKNYANAQSALTRGVSPSDDSGLNDKRFSNKLWRSHPYFSFVRKQYEINAQALKEATGALELPDAVARRRVDWLTHQIIDMMSPTNFLATNPDALEKAVETEGESLVRGLENLVRDVEMNGGEVVVSLADHEAFSVGDNIGTSEGTVVHRTRMLELIQYKPKTEKVHAIPIVIFPPWINKFYILDLKPQNSLINWLVEQGYTVFVVSWKNPDSSYSNVGMSNYADAYLDVMDKVLEQTGQKKLNAVGYCIAGTTLSMVLGLLKKRGDDRVNSATFFTTLTDFSDQGEFVTFLQDDFIVGIEEEVKRHGMMRAQLMSRTMSFLRANDLVWGPAIRSYMMGENPPAFDLLFWNGDSTNLPGKMAMEYLKGLCQQNLLAEEGFEIKGEKVNLSDVTVPLCSIACETDHIAPWKDCWRGVSQMGSKDKTFILSESGHIAGIVNPPSKKKYGHYAGGKDFDNGYEAWRESATFNEGSWWPMWDKWLTSRSGNMVDARDPGEGLDPAPGTYVHQRAI